MERFSTAIWRRIKFVLATALLSVFLVACEGDQGVPGPPGENAISTTITTTTVSYATSLVIKIDSVSINSAPVVNFSVSNQDGTALVGLTTSDLRFTIAKLVPGSFGDASAWQSYINQESDGGMRGSQERDRDGYPLGTLLDNSDGSYSYTFETNLDEAAANCPDPCTDADGNELDVSYNPALTHRVVIQLSHSTANLPPMNAIYTFRPSDGVTDPKSLFAREIVKTENCNECHNQLSVHGSRVEVQYCVMCHNPGTWDGGNGNTADFKVMIHKIHMGEDLPSVVGGGSYEIGGHDYSDVVFPQDIRNCTKCHDGSDPDNNPRATSEGGNWETQVSMEACGSCHDKLKFDVAGPPVPGATDPDGHPGGVQSDNSLCTVCHSESGPEAVGSVAERHTDPVNLAATRFKYNILEICAQPVPDPDDPDDTTPFPKCVGTNPAVVKFSVTDPTGATHGVLGDKAAYDITKINDADYVDPEFGASASLNIVLGWMSGESVPAVPGIDFTNEGLDSDPATGTRPARAKGYQAVTTITETDPGPPPVYSYTNLATDNGDGTFSITLDAIPGTPTSGVIAIEGHPRGAPDYDYNVPVRGVVAYFGVNGGDAVERRVAVDIASKCDNCHNKLSLHGANRADNAELCVICHNPRNTDVNNRPKDLVTGLPITYTAPDGDGKTEESIDLKRLIHGIHAAKRDDPNTPAVVEGHGFREKGLGIQGYRPGINYFNDFGHIRFPGILSDCTTCHQTVNGVGTYELTGKWDAPLQNGIPAVTILAIPEDISGTYVTQAEDQSNDLMITPTAAVCSSCHDGVAAQGHMETIGGAKFSVLQAVIDSSIESCSVCHGPGKIADVKVVHGVK